jgi:hypothetical protein
LDASINDWFADKLADTYKYLVSIDHKKKAHVWVDDDSACRMWSTGGIQNRRDWTVVEMHAGRAICQTCKSVTGMGRSH